MAQFRDLLLDSTPHLFDGAMGTMLYARGVFINRCYDELNVADPELIKGIHREYVKAGAELLETNSFGANRVKLAQYGLEAQVRAINAAAGRLAREAAAGKALVGGSMGPLGVRIGLEHAGAATGFDAAGPGADDRRGAGKAPAGRPA